MSEGDPFQSAEYQRFVEEQAKHCHCDGNRPCDGLLAGGPCDGFRDNVEDEGERHRCDRCGGDGFIEYNDGDGGDWGEDCPSEVNHLITCRACNGTGGGE